MEIPISPRYGPLGLPWGKYLAVVAVVLLGAIAWEWIG
jgi:hypothetical protein